MCIICNLPDPMAQMDTADAFLSYYSQAQFAMAKATESMLAVSRLDLKPEDRRRYDRTHKQMKRVLRDWNRIEHRREANEA